MWTWIGFMRLNITSLRIPLKTKFFINYATVSFSRDSTSWYCTIPIGCVVAARFRTVLDTLGEIKENTGGQALAVFPARESDSATS